MKIPPFIATLGMMMVDQGLDADPFRRQADLLRATRPTSARSPWAAAVMPGFDIPMGVLIFFGAAIVAALILTKTILGRYTFALGSNEEATRLSGVNTDAWKMAIYALGGAFAGLGGVVMASPPELGAARAGRRLRTGRHSRGGHRRHLAVRRRRHHPGHRHRRLHHHRR